MDQPYVRGLSGWRPLARGGFAFVWEARQLALDRPVAVKVYPRESADGDRRGFPREAAAAGMLSGHPGIVTVYDAGTLPDDRPYLIMELCPGGSLAQWLKPGHRRSPERVRQVGVRVADALAAVHARGVAHGDIKPANILIDGYGNPRLTDFGLAVVAGGEPVSGALRITPAYAPQEAFGTQPTTSAADVFSLAATLYALLAGCPPRGGDTVGMITREEMAEAASRPISPIPGIDPLLMGVLMTALSGDPAARPTAEMFREQLATAPEKHRSKHRSMVDAVNHKLPVLTGKRRDAGVRSASVHDGVAVTAVPAAPRRAADRLGSAEPRRSRGKKHRVGILVAALAAVVASAAAWLMVEPASSGAHPAIMQSETRGGESASLDPSGTAESQPQTSALPEGAGNAAGSASVDQAALIQVDDSELSAKPFRPVRIQGTYLREADATLQVQRWEAGRWLAFPIPTTTDQSGRFTAYVEVGAPSRYRLRILNPDSGVTSEPFELVIKG